MARTKGRSQVEKLNAKLERLVVEYAPVDSLKPNPWNPNRQTDHEQELLRRSMDEDGFTQPLLVARVTEEDKKDPKFERYDIGDLVIVDGEHRWRMGAELGYTELPIVLAPFGAIQARISTIRHNKARGSHDLDLEADMLRDLQTLGALDWAADSLDLDDVELNRLLEDIPASEALAADDFSEAWEPASDSASESEGRSVSLTPAAVSAQREAEEKARMAKTEEDRAQARREANVFRLNVAFSGDEGQEVRKALGDNPAERVLMFCRQYLASLDSEAVPE
jgi:ParB-like chromosome segregation protein Spo0J